MINDGLDDADPALEMMMSALKIETRQMRYFVAVAKTLNFRRAAEELCISQPALTRAIHQVEDTIGAPLLERDNQHVEMTEVGRTFLKGCQRTLSSAEHTVRDTLKVRDGDSGSFTLAYTDSAINGILPKILKDFRLSFPNIDIYLIDMSTTEQLEALAQGDIHIGFLTGPVFDAGLDQITMQRDHLVVILPDTHPLAVLDKIPVAKLADEPFITGYASNSQAVLQHIKQVCKNEGFYPKIVQEVRDGFGLFGLAAADIGISLCLDTIEVFSRKGVAVRRLEDVDYTIPTIAIWNNEDVLPSLALFTKFIIEWLQIHGTTQ